MDSTKTNLQTLKIALDSNKLLINIIRKNSENAIRYGNQYITITGIWKTILIVHGSRKIVKSSKDPYN